MSYYIGVDLGTSAVKVLLLSEQGIEKVCTKEYPCFSPEESFSEQNPYDWYDKSMAALKELLQETDKEQIKSISFSGQMHGLVLLDEKDESIRPAILWNDGRSVKEVEYLNKTIGKEFLLEHTANIAFAGFTAPKLLWVKEHEQENFARIHKIMLPKDYLAYRLSGEFCTDVSDASGTLYFDVKNKCWSKAMLELLGVNEKQLPKVLESREVAGNLRKEIAEELGLPSDVKIVIGAGDNAASAVGTGVTEPGACNISLGTSGTIFVEAEEAKFDLDSAIHTFASASGHFHYLACILSAASAQKWWLEDILHTDYDMTGLREYMGENHVFFLPYLSGERSPINDTGIRGMFLGLSANTTREEMSMAVLEGVAFALKQNLEIIRSMGVKITKAKICGGGARNPLWLEVIANVLNLTLEIPENEQGGALGAALLAAKGCILKEEYEVLASKYHMVKTYVEPKEKLVKRYQKCYEQYLSIYPSVKYLFSFPKL